MKPSEYRAALAVVGLTAGTVQQLFQIDQSTGRRWATGEQAVPRAVELSLLLMASRGVSAGQALVLVGEQWTPRRLDAA